MVKYIVDFNSHNHKGPLLCQLQKAQAHTFSDIQQLIYLIASGDKLMYIV